MARPSMRFAGAHRPTLLLCLLIILACLLSVIAKKDAPEVKRTKFETPLFGLQYFEDSENVLALAEYTGTLWWSDNAGAEWQQAEGIPRDEIDSFWLHPTDNNKAYALGLHEKHWFSKDRGRSWELFRLPDLGAAPSKARYPLSFHAGNSAKVIINAMECDDRQGGCEEMAYYTVDDFQTVERLRDSTRGCLFAHGTPEFVPSSRDHDDDRALCIVRGPTSPWSHDWRLRTSDNFFRDDTEPKLEQGRPVAGIISMAVVKGYLVAAASSQGTSELALYVTTDAEKWHRAQFPQEHKLEKEAYTILESTNYSIQVDVMTTMPVNPMGVLFSSDSEGKFFTENIRHTNRNLQGIVDFEKVSNIQGIVMVNVVDNPEEVDNVRSKPKKIKSLISFDDGRTFDGLTIAGQKREQLHLHSVTAMANSGRTFSSPAPGLAMGVGNVGEHLGRYVEGDTYVSDDAAVTWRKALDGAHKYEFGDQGSVLVAVSDEGPTDKLMYSLNHGSDWKEVDLQDKVDVKVLTTTPDSTSRKFVMEATKRVSGGIEYWIYSFDFDQLHEGKCTDRDFEDWPARVDSKGEPTCLMGHKQSFRRRKANADCFVDRDFKEPLPQNTPCACQESDYECAVDFMPEGTGKERTCQPIKPLTPPDGACLDGNGKRTKKGTFKGPSGFRLIPGNDCQHDRGVDLTKDLERSCESSFKAQPGRGEIQVTRTSFHAQGFGQKVYLERSKTSQGGDETVIMSTVRDGVIDAIWLTRDQGKEWEQILEDVDNIRYIVPHQYEHDQVYFLTGSTEVWYSVNRMDTLQSFEVPHRLDEDLNPLSFHPTHHNYLIWTGVESCGHRGTAGEPCQMTASYTTDRGDHWETLARACQKCEFIQPEEGSEVDHLIYCEQHQKEDTRRPLELRSSENWFADSTPHFDDILTFVTMSGFIIVAQKDADSNLHVEASVDGKTFANARFPPNFNVPHRTAYTVLDSSTRSIFLHVTVGTKANFDYGRIMKSNSNGTSYALSIDAVNQNADGFVDFEKMQGIEGVALVNVVANLDEEKDGKKKRLRSLITHNDGAQWDVLPAPPTDHEGHKWKCDTSKPEECSLHLHSYTERSDPRDTFSSPSAVGLMLGVGNVGSSLGWKGDEGTYTFITRNGGIEWSTVAKGSYIWEYGDKGSVIVIVPEGETREGMYTLDEGGSWNSFAFTDEDVRVLDLTTVPSDSSRSFIIWAARRNDVVTYSIDFSGMRPDRICSLEDHAGTNNKDEGDFTLWSPRHPSQEDDCLFGHVAQYHRKKPDADCWIGTQFEPVHNQSIRNCPCKRTDFECDYNYELRPADSTCALVEGLQSLNASDICKTDPSTKSYFESLGYRKIPISTCTGGDEHKYLGTEHPCPDHEEEFATSHGGLSGFGFFVVVILLPVAAAVGIGWFVWTRFLAGDGRGRFGRIQLGESLGSSTPRTPGFRNTSGGGSLFDADGPLVHYPVVALSAAVAIVAATPMLLSAGYRALMGAVRGTRGGSRFTSRQSFARGRGEYAIVDPDEDELLGDDDEEEAP